MSFDRRITPFRPDLADERLRGRVEAERFSAGRLRRVTAPSAPVRRHPAPDAPLDTEALMGERVTVYDDHEGWAWGQLEADGYVGYLPSAALDEPGLEPTHKLCALRGFVFPGPNLKLPHAGFLSLGARVAVTDIQGDYARLATGGFVYRPILEAVDACEPDFVAVAERFLHTPYLWGGKTSLGLDCSGLVQTALGAAGIASPRDSDQQEKALGEPVEIRPDLSGLRRGDLVFWNGHVGIMVDASHLIHANGHHMTTLIEPLVVAEERIRTRIYGPITSVKRFSR
jgi:Bacterial dipeptidyl-peptidase Sh3 domain/NlpC/P60 family